MTGQNETVQRIGGDGQEAVGAVMVLGAGITGMQTSLDLAESGFKVFLVESKAAIGGNMAQLDKTFPTGDCAMCILSPKLVECARNKNIEIITMADVESVEGKPGNLQVKLTRRPRFVDAKKCNACGDCVEACPVSLPNEFDRRLGTRKAISRLYPQAIPNLYGISKAPGRSPCKASCPAGVNAQGYVALIAAKKFKEAYELIRERAPLPAACGRVCQHPCQSECNRAEVDEAVNVRDLKRFAADWMYAHRDEIPAVPAVPAQKEKVAIVGGGPAGLTTAFDLASQGYGVTIFESAPELGGMLRYGIPAYRLEKEVLDLEVRQILGMGVQAKCNTRIDDPRALLKSGGKGDGAETFDAVFLAPGAWVSRTLNVPGEEAQGVWSGLKFLYEVNSGRKPAVGPNVVVIGGGDVAMDAARCALRLPGVQSVRVACLESRKEMPAHAWEAKEALDEGVTFHNRLGPTRINAANGKVTGISFRACTRVFDENKKFNPQFDDAKITDLTAETVIITIGQGIDAAALGVTLGAGGRIAAARGGGATNVAGIFAGGDAVLGPASMVDAMAQGHQAAQAIMAFLRGSDAPAAPALPGATKEEFAPNPTPDVPRQPARKMPQAPVAERKGGFHVIDLGYSEEDAVAEAKRCLACGLCSECMQCVKACSAGAVQHNAGPVTQTISVGSVVLTPGFEEFQASLRGEFGHGRYSNVLSSVQFERMLSAAGPTGGHVERPSDGGPVKKIGFIQCVGSRDPARGAGYCSSICCMSATKEAMVAIEHQKGLDVSVFCMDIRAFGKEFDSYVNRAREENDVKFIRAIPSRVVEMPGTKNARVRYFDENGAERFEEFDILVLSVGMRPSASLKALAGRIGLDLNEFGYCETDRLSPMAASRPGVYVAGAFQEPKDIPESVAQASGAAACAMAQLADARGTLTVKREYPWERDVTDEDARIGVFICHCGHNIASVVDVEAVAAKARTLANVCHAEASIYTCSDTNQQHMKDMISEHNLTRLVVASCSPRTHEILFQETLRESGLNPYLFAMTNIRDQCSWVHKEDPVAATSKAQSLMAMAVARARYLKALPTGQQSVKPAALILGGGLAGMTAALAVADQGFDVHLVEKESVLGGNLRKMHTTLERADVPKYLADLSARVTSHAHIKVYLGSQLKSIAGHVGDFKSRVASGEKETELTHGVVILAIGGTERTTALYEMGKSSRVVTQTQLEEQLVSGQFEKDLGQAPRVVMIQCVESRNEEHAYCSRVCCSEAVKNALEIKRRRPEAQVVVLARDIRTYGFRELYFQKAREAGVLFVRYPDKKDPLVTQENGKLVVRVIDASTNTELQLQPDLLALSVGIAPAQDNPILSGLMRSALTGDGFFLEAHPKLRPVDLANEGEFICGLTHSPRFIDETIAQARAAAARATTVLSKTHLEIPGQVARVNPDNCVACATCVRVCPYGAPMINDLHKAEIQGAMCMGCGSCAASCPARTITLQHQEDRQLIAMLEELQLVEGASL
jgi:heterodisulfide reductase subunit A-like polyferredoxin